MASSESFRIVSSPGFPAWLEQLNISLAFSTYQLGKLFLVGRKTADQLAVFERSFNRCLGLCVHGESLWLAAAFQLWRLENVLTAGKLVDDTFDRLYVPQAAFTTGDIDVHDIVVDGNGEVIFVNTLFSCLAKRSSRYSFTPLWRPPFIDRLAAEDRCHLNGVAIENGTAAYVTCCALSNQRGGWREQRSNGGAVLETRTNNVLVTGLSMPHSPRVHDQQLWLLNSGVGFLGRVDRQRGKFEPLVFCPGYARGLTLVDRYAIVGLSRPRAETFSGLELDDQLRQHRQRPVCGLMVVDLQRAVTVEWLQIEGTVDELYDVVVLPGARRPKALGLKNDDIRHNVWFDEDGGVSHWVAGGDATDRKL